MTGPTPFAIVGAGWRSAFYLRVARELPGRFRVTGVMTGDAARIAALERDWMVAIRSTIDEVLADAPAFVVLSVPRTVMPRLLIELAERSVPVLAETPPAADLAALQGLVGLAASSARIQVAEQYQFQPLHAARIATIRQGLLGSVSEVQVSVAHDYHAMDLVRRYLDLSFDAVTITARRFIAPIVAGPDRGGPPREERIVSSEQIIAWLEFEKRFAVYDFTSDQYFSWIRGPRVLVRGERGEIRDTTVSFLRDATTPIGVEMIRRDTGHDGNLEGLHLAGITVGPEWVYRNPFAPARLADDEIAVATCLQEMAEYVQGGRSFCTLAEAAWDHELSLRIGEAADSGRSIRVTAQLWAT